MWPIVMLTKEAASSKSHHCHSAFYLLLFSFVQPFSFGKLFIMPPDHRLHPERIVLPACLPAISSSAATSEYSFQEMDFLSESPHHRCCCCFVCFLHFCSAQKVFRWPRRPTDRMWLSTEFFGATVRNFSSVDFFLLLRCEQDIIIKFKD